MNAARILVATGLGIALVTSPLFARNDAQKGGQQTVAVDQLPAAVTAAVEKAYPKSTIVSAAKINRGGQSGYELSVKTSPDAQPIAVMSTADGMIRTGAKTAPPAAGTPAPRKGARKGGAANVAQSLRETTRLPDAGPGRILRATRRPSEICSAS